MDFVRSIDKLTLGELRNLAIESANGQYVAQWDDDDLYDPSRLQHQIDLIEKSKSNACMLSRWTVWWPNKNRLFISGKRTWEGSLVCKRASMPRYPSLTKGEDTPLINELLSSNKVVFLDAPRLYIYVIHGSNTWNEKHFENIYLNLTVNFTSNSYFKILNELSRRVSLFDYFCKPNLPHIKSTNTDHLKTSHPSISILTPMRNAKKHLNQYFKLIESLHYPRELISIGIIEGESIDGTWQSLKNLTTFKQHYFASISITKFDTGFKYNVPRWSEKIQFSRRSNLANVRNKLIENFLSDQDWVLWIDPDVIEYPKDLIHQLLSYKKQILTPLWGDSKVKCNTLNFNG